MKRALLLAMMSLLIMVTACQPAINPSPTVSPLRPSPEESPLGAPTTEPDFEPTAAPTQDPLLLLPPGVKEIAPAFRMDPLILDATEVSGQGPVGFTLVIVDATSSARILAQGQANADGSFRFPLSEALVAGHLVGLTVDLSQEQLASDPFMLLLFEARGPGFRIVPRVVTVFDSVEAPSN